MKKVFKIEDIDCAHCAAKMEAEILKLDGVISARVNFLAEKLTLEADDGVFDSVLKQACDICKKIEPDCKVIIK